MKISGTTKVIGIFGDPIGHTLSPVMQNAAFEAMGLNMVYLPFHVVTQQLEAAVSGIKAFDMPGINVTVPHKESIMDLLDEVSDEARDIGAVNTVVNRGGKLYGYNTDGKGYLFSLANEMDFVPEGKSIIILGAGGAARAIASSLLIQKPESLIIANRTLERAETLAEELNKKFKRTDIKAAELSRESLDPFTDGTDLLINTTSLGMTGKEDLDLKALSLGRFSKYAVVSDIVYRPLDTGLIQAAQEGGLRVHRGLGMLVYQGALSFELWTGRKPPVEVMKMACMEELRST